MIKGCGELYRGLDKGPTDWILSLEISLLLMKGFDIPGDTGTEYDLAPEYCVGENCALLTENCAGSGDMPRLYEGYHASVVPDGEEGSG